MDKVEVFRSAVMTYNCKTMIPLILEVKQVFVPIAHSALNLIVRAIVKLVVTNNNESWSV